jgi:hypothetical protein
MIHLAIARPMGTSARTGLTASPDPVFPGHASSIEGHRCELVGHAIPHCAPTGHPQSLRFRRPDSLPRSKSA